jgi:hypothetical protein
MKIHRIPCFIVLGALINSFSAYALPVLSFLFSS